VVSLGCISPVGREQADELGAGGTPLSRASRGGGNEVLEALAVVGVAHRYVAGQQVVQGGDVGRPLDAGVPSEGEDSPARPAHIAEEELENRRGPDALYSDGVLGPSHGVGKGRRAVTAGVVGQRL